MWKAAIDRDESGQRIGICNTGRRLFDILGVIPVILFYISSATAVEINGILFGLSVMGLTSPYVDSCNVYQVLKQTSKSDRLQFYGDDLYVISEKP